MKTQNKEILEYLRTGNTLTPIQALKKFNCFRLGARIYDLKEKGYSIQTKMISDGRKRFAEYKLVDNS